MMKSEILWIREATRLFYNAWHYDVALACGCLLLNVGSEKLRQADYNALDHTCARELQPAPPPQLQTPRLGRVA
jgi:hypothetical protein